MRGKREQPVTSSDDRLTCPHCTKTWAPRGFDNHLKACKRKADTAERDLRVLRGIERAENQCNPVRLRAPSPELQDCGTYVTAAQGDEIDNLNTDLNDCATIYETMPPHETLETDLQTTSDVTAPPASCAQLEYDDIRVHYHPHSGRGTKIYAFEDYQRERLQPAPPEPEPWRPFACREDFEFAEAVQQAGMTETQVKTLLRIISGVADGTSAFSLRSYKDLSCAWEKAMLNQPSFEKHTITVPHHTGDKTYDIYVRDVEELIVKQLKDPNLLQYFQWDARRMSKWKGTHWEDFVESEPVTGSKMWDVQSQIPKDAKPLGIFLYADKNKLSSFGTQQGYPVVMRITNIETHVRNGDGLGGGHVVAFLPVVTEESGETGKTTFANFKREVWHTAMEKIIAPLIRLSGVGLAVRCADAVRRLFHIFLNILSGDYEELCSMVLIRGNQCLHPCPMCLIPHDHLSDLSQEWPSRTQQQAQEILCQSKPRCLP